MKRGCYSIGFIKLLRQKNLRHILWLEGNRVENMLTEKNYFKFLVNIGTHKFQNKETVSRTY